MVGSIDATCSDQATTIDFLGDRIVFRFSDYRAASKLQQFLLPHPDLIARLLRFSGQSVFAKIGKRKEMQLFPDPSWIIRLLSPQLRRLVQAGQ